MKGYQLILNVGALDDLSFRGCTEVKVKNRLRSGTRRERLKSREERKQVERVVAAAALQPELYC